MLRELLGRFRSHWGIENSLHWTLDVTFCEDEAGSETELSRKFCTSTSASNKFTETRKNFYTKFKRYTIERQWIIII
jgi:predicted transposase YbfD/YdcC